jgi:hypothetical protein
VKKHLAILMLIATLAGCNNSKTSGEQSAATSQTETSADQPSTPNNKGSNVNATQNENGKDIIGEWLQEYAVLDQNGNAKLEQEERNGTKSHMGFNWFRFNSDGNCQYDSDIKFKGTYEVIENNGKRKLNVTVNGFGETYKYTIVDPVTDELVLYSSGAFMIFKKA